MHICKICNYYTDNNSNYHKHMKTVKHLKNVANINNNESQFQKKDRRFPHLCAKNSQNRQKITRKSPILLKCIPKGVPPALKSGDAWNGQKEKTKMYMCEFCKKLYSTNSNFNRHIKTCTNALSVSKNIENVILEKSIDEEDKITMESLLNRIQELENTPRTQTNINITVNAYGQENLNFISDGHIMNLLKSFHHASMIPKLVKDIHCNPAHPENMNVYKPNKKDEYVMIYDGTQWTIGDGKKVIGKMIDDKISFLDDRLYHMTNTIPHFQFGFEKIEDAALDGENRKKWYGQIALDLINNKYALITSGKDPMTAFS
jgi:hypothetical protein